MTRFSHYDTDEERLPEGMTRVGYDADTQVYTFRDVDGSYWESAPGCQYGELRKVSDGDADEIDDSAPFLGSGHHSDLSWRSDMRPLLNFGLLVGLSLLLFFWFLRWSVSSKEEMKPMCPEDFKCYTINGGDTCWDIAEKHGLSVDDILKNNAELDCDALQVNSKICLPKPSNPVDAKDPVV
ncbi:hypothetical protein BGZ63DRAFT_404932 [Mariannaea sp. PMI_226]|nr:hypothetical protein BGZ63DRAFT_404932 [Mariannaea sp. PMI_226]